MGVRKNRSSAETPNLRLPASIRACAWMLPLPFFLRLFLIDPFLLPMIQFSSKITNNVIA
jgi:hypothetical protein